MTDQERRELVRVAVEAAIAVLQARPLPPLSVDQHLSTTEIAPYVGRTPETVRRWITERGLPAKQIDGSWMVRWGDFLAWQPGEDDMLRLLEDGELRSARLRAGRR